MTKISQLSQDTTPQSGDQVAIVDSISGATKRMTFSDLSKIMQTLLMPSGVVQNTAASTAPSGWLICDGSAISRTTYASLYAAIGTTYGTGDGSTTFNIPDLRGRTTIGVGTATGAAGATAHTLGQKAGEEAHTLALSEVPNVQGSTAIHGGENGSIFANASGAFTAPSGYLSTYKAIGATAGASSVAYTLGFNNGGGGGAHNNMQPYVAMNYIIKT